MKSKQFFYISAVMAAINLTACGGGGDGGGGGQALPVNGMGAMPGQVQNPVVVKTPETQLIQTVSSSSYPAGSEDLAAFNKLNAERSQCGFGKLTQSTQIDAAARAHNDYQIINNTDSHFENKTQFPTGFTGVTGLDRVIAAGYTDAQAVKDDYVYKTSLSKVGVGEGGIRSLLSAPYHMSGLLGSSRDVGLSVRSNTESTPQGVSPVVFVHVNTAIKGTAGPQLIEPNDVATYPCAGSITINRQLTDEIPNPVPGRDLRASPIGSAVYISLREGNVLNIASATMVETVSNTAVVLRSPITKANDPNALYKVHEGYVAPDAPLKALTQYSVDIRGTNNGIAFTRQFSFTTGA